MKTLTAGDLLQATMQVALSDEDDTTQLQIDCGIGASVLEEFNNMLDLRQDDRNPFNAGLAIGVIAARAQMEKENGNG